MSEIIVLLNEGDDGERITAFLDSEYDAGRIGGWYSPMPGTPSKEDRCPVTGDYCQSGCAKSECKASDQ